MDNFLKFLKIRRSIRAFGKQSISKKQLEKIVDAARFAPTARNLQPWEFVVVTDTHKLSQLAQLGENGKFMEQAAACIAVFSADTKYFLEDGSAATCNILLASTALGIGSCWVAGDKKPYAQQVNTLLNAPPSMKLISMVALGYPLEKNVFKAIAKRELKELLHWEKF
ncbi:MAG: nitroreductase family protein [Candidatus Omnitrophica bacterium]|nr:nitroreductase family protein [Candidatus Omnitrophota bacterium]MBU4303851.1 nitroreductase family protein [Candidatus Omnitrophota bacterium]MBU4467704.1 nitroreductase family protein [Candidatus Omnitrophota bacterium]MCG2707440.1 nitroreductase family protein [Candidatus Omnitrophota bacterium]